MKLHKRPDGKSDNWYIHLIIPKVLHSIFRSDRFIASTKTSNKALAWTRAAEIVVGWERELYETATRLQDAGRFDEIPLHAAAGVKIGPPCVPAHDQPFHFFSKSERVMPTDPYFPEMIVAQCQIQAGQAPHPQVPRESWYGRPSFKTAMRIALSLLAATLIPRAQALTLSEALTLALDNEPTFLAAKAGAAAARERNRQAFAGMLPLVSASVVTNSDRRNYLTRGSTVPAADDKFNSNTQQLTLTQPLWRHANMIAVKQSESVVSQNEYLLAAARQDLYVKLIAAWCDTMLARDVISFNRRQAATALQQLKAQQRGLSLGIVSAPALEEARARYEQARTDEAVSEADMNVKIAQLEQIVGPIRSFTPPFLSSRFADLNLGWLRIDQWLDAIATTSPTILAAERNLEAANAEVKKQRAGHEATLDLVASYNHNGQSVGNFPGQDGYDIRQGAVGLQLSVPIYSGGGQSAKTAEAIDLKEKARQELEGARRTTRLAAKQAWFGLQAALLRSEAAQQARRLWTVALQAAVKGQASGTNSELEILQARQQLEGAKRDLNKARYDMITSYFRLHAAAGQLNEADIKALQDFMVPDDEMAQETQTAASK